MIEAPRPELYDLQADVGEARDRSHEDPARLEAMRRDLQKAMAAHDAGSRAGGRRGDGRAAGRARLRRHGGGSTVRPRRSGRDPKDGERARHAARPNGMSVVRTEPEEAIRELTALLAEDPGMLMARRHAGRRLRRRPTSTRPPSPSSGGLEKDGSAHAPRTGSCSATTCARRPPEGGDAQSSSAPRARTRSSPSPGSPSPRSTSRSRSSTRPPRPTRRSSRSTPTTRGPPGPRRPRAARRRPTRPRPKLRAHPRDGARGRRRDGPSWASSKVRTGRPDEAIGLFRRAIEREPKNGEASCTSRGRSPRPGTPPRPSPTSSARSPRARARRWRSTASPSRVSSSGTGRGPRRRFASRCSSTRSSPTSRGPFGTWAGPDRAGRRGHRRAQLPAGPSITNGSRTSAVWPAAMSVTRTMSS